VCNTHLESKRTYSNKKFVPDKTLRVCRKKPLLWRINKCLHIIMMMVVMRMMIIIIMIIIIIHKIWVALLV